MSAPYNTSLTKSCPLVCTQCAVCTPRSKARNFLEEFAASPTENCLVIVSAQSGVSRHSLPYAVQHRNKKTRTHKHTHIPRNEHGQRNYFNSSGPNLRQTQSARHFCRQFTFREGYVEYLHNTNLRPTLPARNACRQYTIDTDSEVAWELRMCSRLGTS